MNDRTIWDIMTSAQVSTSLFLIVIFLAILVFRVFRKTSH